MEDRKADGIGFIAGKWPLDPKEATIVFIHGAGGSSNFWQAQIEGLAERVNTVAVDLPGHGRSDGNGCSSIEDYSRAMVNFMRAVKVPRPIPCGISLGGAIVQQLLLDYPDFFEVAILISTGSRLKVAPEIFATVASPPEFLVTSTSMFLVTINAFSFFSENGGRARTISQLSGTGTSGGSIIRAMTCTSFRAKNGATSWRPTVTKARAPCGTACTALVISSAWIQRSLGH